MKAAFYSILILLSLGCQNKKVKKEDWNIEDLTKDEVEYIKVLYDQETEWNEYEKLENKILGLLDLGNLELTKGQRIYQFQVRAKYDKYKEIIEIADYNTTDEINFKAIRYQVDRNCNPIIGNLEFTRECIEIIKSQNGTISRIAMDSLNKTILDNGFWEFTEQESEIRKYSDILYHGESWSLFGAYSIDYPSINGTDTTVTKFHKVYRMIPDDFESFRKIGKHIQNAINKKVSR